MNDNDQDPVAMLVRLAGRRPGVDAERMARVRAAVHDEWQGTVGRRRWTRIGIATAAAATIAGVLLVRSVPEQTAPVAQAPIVAQVQYGSGAGQALQAGAEIALPDHETASLEWNGATLRLDGGTRLRFDALNVATLSRGAIYYAEAGASAGRAESPSLQGVTIRTPLGDVRDVGTRFEVRLRDDTLRVRVREGAVLVRSTTARAGTEVVATRTSITERTIATSGDEWSWIENAAPPIVLEGKTLDAVLRHIAAEKGLTLDWKGSGQTLHGDLPLTTNEALDAATAAAGVSYRIDGDRLIVRSRS